MSNIDWEPFEQIIERSQNIILTSHIRPDCDALGSELGMAGLLDQLGKQVQIVNGHPTPPSLQFIDPGQRLNHFGTDTRDDVLNQADLLIILDTSAWAQLKPMESWIRQFSGKKVIIDHHVSEDEFGAELFKDTTAEATGRLVIECADALGVTLTPQMASPLFAAIATDTGWFRFKSVNSGTYQLASRLMEAGVCPADVYADLYERETPGRVRLRGRVLSRIHVEQQGRLAHTYILKEDYQETGAHPSDTEDLVNHCLEINGVQFAIIMIEQPEGGFKISFRSRCELACNEIAGKFDGGGHAAAAGAFLNDTFANVREQVVSHVRAQMSPPAPAAH